MPNAEDKWMKPCSSIKEVYKKGKVPNEQLREETNCSRGRLLGFTK